MHYSVMIDTSELNLYSYLYNFLNVIFEVFFILLPFSFIAHKNVKIYIIPVLFIFILCLAHTLYGYYFESYIPFSLLTEFNNLKGLTNNIFSAISFSAISIIILVIITISYIAKSKTSNKIIYPIYIFILTIVSISTTFVFALEWKVDKNVIIFKAKNKFTSYRQTNYAKSMFELGLVKNLICDIIQNNNSVSPKISDIQKIDSFINNKTALPIFQDSIRYNLIILIIESLNSEALNRKINGFEITPNINTLVKSNYYNANVIQETQKGESSDGQFIYLTGLLPQNNGITIIDYFNNQFISFVKLIKNKYPNYSTQMIIPTSSSFWRQKEMCIKYEIDSLFSSKDYPNPLSTWLNDEEVIDLAISKISEIKEPFISIVLTSSTHSPYDNSIHNSNIQYPNNYPIKYRNYLDAVNYVDLQIGKYIDYIYNQDWYDRTIVLILSDHQAHNKLFDMDINDYNSNTPLIMINSPIPITRDKDSTIYQSDIFPTILDVMGIDSRWRGIGTSLYDENIPNNESIKKEISSQILESNYFNFHNP